MTEKIIVLVKKLFPEAQLPKMQTEGSAGADLYASETTVLYPHCTRMVSCGIAVEILPGYELQIRPRSGLAAKHDITVLNSPGTIDSDFRGEIKVIMHNAGAHNYTVVNGDRIAQAVLSKVPVVEYIETEELSETVRGEGGFGNTGK